MFQLHLDNHAGNGEAERIVECFKYDYTIKNARVYGTTVLSRMYFCRWIFPKFPWLSQMCV
jgi:hypothetical protein